MYTLLATRGLSTAAESMFCNNKYIHLLLELVDEFIQTYHTSPYSTIKWIGLLRVILDA